jgi:prepilin-type N-terminal cleavage/methylation domain-containing protein
MKQKAFTLIELLVVIAIIGLLASIVVVNVNSARSKASTAKGVSFSQQIYHAMGSDCVGYWDFNKIINDNQVTDMSGNGNTGYVTGAIPATSLVFSGGNFGNALNFNGISDYVSIADSPTVNPASITIGMWIYLNSDLNCDGGNNWRALIYKGSTAGTATGYDIVLEENRAIAWDTGTASSDRWWPDGISIPIGKWSYLVVSYDQITGKKNAYQDGDLKATKTVTAGPLLSNNSNLIISNSSTACPSGSGCVPGLIDEVRIYGSALSSAEIQKHYAEGLVRRLSEK